MPYVTYFLLDFNHLNTVSLLHIGHASFPLVYHWDKFPYVGKSFIIHNNDACNLNVCCVDALYIIRHSIHNSSKSSTNSCKYTSILFLGALVLGINKDNNIYGSFIHLHWGKLYGISTTGHMLYDVLILPNGLKPSLVKPSCNWGIPQQTSMLFIKLFSHYWISWMF